MGYIQLNDKLVARLKIGLTAKQFWNESRWNLRKRGPCCICHDDQVLHKILNFTARESTDRQTCEWMNSMKFRVGPVSWPNTGHIKL